MIRRMDVVTGVGKTRDENVIKRLVKGYERQNSMKVKERKSFAEDEEAHKI